MSQKEKVVIQKQQRDLYSQIQTSSNEKSPEKRKEAKNLYHFYDKKIQKIELNPAVQYISTSQAAVFEMREKEHDNETNRYI